MPRWSIGIGALVPLALCAAGTGPPGGAPSNSSLARHVLFNIFAKAHASDPELGDFRSFVEAFGKRYDPGDWEDRFATFKVNLAIIRVHNAGNRSFKLDVNQYADLSAAEFAKGWRGLNVTNRGALLGDLPLRAAGTRTKAALPNDVDWVMQGALPPVLDQGSCGGCWAFTATAALSAAWKIATGRLEALSQQQFMDCSVPYGNEGCSGGNMDNAFMYARGAALCTATSYQYDGGLEACRKECTVVIPRGAVVGYRLVQERNEQALMEAVAGQPVAVGIEAEEEPAFQLYSTGVMSGPGVCGSKPNHAVLVVGYGTLDAKPYWLIRNSWGPTWGERGYFKLERGAGPEGLGECGILVMPSYPVLNAASRQTPGNPLPLTAPADLVAYGKPPCPNGVHASSLSILGDALAQMCTPECSSDTRCPAPGKCILKERTSKWAARRFCAVVCADDEVCPLGARCASSGDGGAGLCVFSADKGGGGNQSAPLLLNAGSGRGRLLAADGSVDVVV